MANDSPTTVRVSGYLEKKSKLRIVSPWKRYWFVLEGRLLLYYRSKDEYETLSPCKGSINLCPPCNVKPVQSVAGVFQIECRSNTVILRAEDRSDQERWMQAILAANAQFTNNKRMTHFRYSLDDLPTPTNKTLLRQNSMPYRMASVPKKDILERVSLGSIKKFAKREHKLQNVEPSVVFIDNDQYGIIKEENSLDGHSETVNIENEHYVQTAKPKKRSESIENDQYKKLEETIATTAEYCQIEKNQEENFLRNLEKAEHVYERISKDSLREETMENNLYVQECLEYDVIDKIKEFEELYEDPDSLKKKCGARRFISISNDIDSQSSSSDELHKKKFRFKMFRYFMKSNKSSCQSAKIKPKSGSFLRRVWWKKGVALNSNMPYEAVDYDEVQKQIEKDQKDLQMLQELQDVLEKRRNILQEKLNKNEQKSKSLPTLSKDPIVYKEEAASVVIPIEDKPELPPRQSVLEKNQDSDEQLQLTSDYANNNDVKSIDEILFDLSEEKNITESEIRNSKVKHLIHKFNDFQNEDDVAFRKKSKANIVCNYEDDRHSDGLNKLLEELSKVTCAPILTPGATYSLITPVMTDEELLEMIPIRSRRLSDPDYDVPRPHRSLQMQELDKDANEEPIPATRFFGPILNVEQKSASIDPDSLEVQNLKEQPPKLSPEEKDFSTFVSHNYQQSNNVDYGQSKSLFGNYVKSANCDRSDTINSNEQEIETNEESFIDSLEPVVMEASTIL